jgi:cytochrome c oxidase subunit 2
MHHSAPWTDQPDRRLASAVPTRMHAPEVGRVGASVSLAREAFEAQGADCMDVRRMKSKSRLAGLAAGGFAALFAGYAAAEELLGQPTPRAIGMQPAASPLAHDAHFFHNAILMPIITVISLFVAALLLWVVIRYNKRSNPIPARWSHNTVIEVIWTLVPVLILMVIAVFSFKLLYAYHDMPKPYMTVKATGYQWYWGYEYPDQQIGEVTSTILPEADAKARGVPYKLAATEPMIVPVNQVIRVQATGADVIHSFGLPAFGLKIDAIPGRLNEMWFKAERTGTYYGQCSELCGVDHAFMPIEIRVVSQPEFDAWVATKAPPPAAIPVAADAEARPVPASANPAPTQVAPVDPASAGPKPQSAAATPAGATPAAAH